MQLRSAVAVAVVQAAAATTVQSLAWERPCAAGAAIKRKKKEYPELARIALKSLLVGIDLGKEVLRGSAIEANQMYLSLGVSIVITPAQIR